MFEKMQQSKQAMFTSFQQELMGGGQTRVEGQGSETRPTHYVNSWTSSATTNRFRLKVVKINFLEYGGSEDPTSWVYQANQFLDYN